MTKLFVGTELAKVIELNHPDSIADHSDAAAIIHPGQSHEVLAFLKQAEDLDFQVLSALTAVDYIEYFEVIYHLLSMRRNTRCVIKARLPGREELTIPSVTDLWRGAELQEREIWDLMGIKFEDHPNMKRILLWEGFPGHPLRKDFIR